MSKTDQQKKEALRKKCVNLAKQISKERDGYRCRYCGEGKPQRVVHSHHIFSEGISKAMSADVDNLITLCMSHHMTGKWVKASNFNFHGTPAEATEWLRENWDNYEELLERSRQIKPLDIRFWEKKHEELKNLI